MSAGTWVAVVAAAAGWSSALTGALNAYLNGRRRPEADWALTGEWLWVVAGLDGEKDPPRFQGRLVNAGDGPAFRVTVRVPDGASTVELRGQHNGDISRVPMALAAVMHPGDFITVVVTSPETEAGDASFMLEWTTPPTRLGKRRSEVFTLSDYAPLGRRPVWDEATGRHV